MCCPLDQVSGKIIFENPSIENSTKSNTFVVSLNGIYDHSPKSLGERVSSYFQRLELLEKIAEVADESFHLFNTVFQQHTNAVVYQTLKNMHHAAHDVEHILHSFCFLGDVGRLFNGTFFKNQEGEKLDLLRSSARICHAAAHFFATAEFLHHLKLCPLDRLEPVFKYANLFSTLGYALWTISLVWDRHLGKTNEHFNQDICIHLGGCLFEATHVIENLEVLSPLQDVILTKVGSIAGIIHALSIVQCLMPPEKEKFKAEVVIHKKGFVLIEESFLTTLPCRPKNSRKKNRQGSLLP